VLTHEPRPGAAQQPPEHERDDDRVVELPRDRDEVRHEVERERQVDERERGRHLPGRRDARVSEQPLEEHRAVGHELRDQPEVPLPRADRDRDDQRRVERRQDDQDQ